MPTLSDVLNARRRIEPHLRSTPLHTYPSLGRLVGTDVWVKHENHQPVGAFKVRGGIDLVSQLDDAERDRGVIAASTGNHGQSIAYAARLFGVRATICVPEGANPVKVDAKAINPAIEVIAVQSEAAPAAYRSWKEGRLVEDRMETFAEGLATRVGFEQPQQILAEHLDDFVLVSDDEIRHAIFAMIEHTRNLVEAAGAAPLAAALRLRERLAGRRVALVCSGGNISPTQLAEVLAFKAAGRVPEVM